MAKDPAFLFYSQAFYESTRMMFPEERACFIDLLIYQHQNGAIPLDTNRITLYCTGVVNQTVNQVLNDKFEKTEDGWINKKMRDIVYERSSKGLKNRLYASLAGLISSNDLTDEQVEFIKSEFKIEHFVNHTTNQPNDKLKPWFYDMVNRSVNHSLNRSVNNNKDKDKDKDKNQDHLEKRPAKKRKVFAVPDVSDVEAYCKERENNINAKQFHNHYASKGWKIGKESMVDWKAAVRTWEVKDREQVKSKNEIVSNR